VVDGYGAGYEVPQKSAQTKGLGFNLGFFAPSRLFNPC
jgi:hypothetical protein